VSVSAGTDVDEAADPEGDDDKATQGKKTRKTNVWTYERRFAGREPREASCTSQIDEDYQADAEVELRSVHRLDPAARVVIQRRESLKRCGMGECFGRN
jgi:hypothetical protein